MRNEPQLVADLDVIVAEPGSPQWESTRQLFDASLDRRPSTVFIPLNTRSSVKLVERLQSASVPFSVKSGGHSAAGLSVLDGVPVVDVSRLRKVRIDRTEGVATIEAGALMRDLDAAALEADLATTGGTVSHTGVVGLAAGGGLGWLMGRFGLACDNIIQAQIVSNGAMAAVKEGDLLLRRVRGSGTSIGYIAELSLRLHRIERTFRWRSIALGPEKQPEHISGFIELLGSLPRTVGTSICLIGSTQGDVSVVVDLVCPLESALADEWAAELRTLGGTATDSFGTYVEMQQLLDDSFPFGRRSYRKSLCLSRIDSGYFEALLGDLCRVSPVRRSVTFDILHGAAMQPVNIAASCFERRPFVALMACDWADPELDAVGQATARQLYEQLVNAHSSEPPATYDNYSSEVRRAETVEPGTTAGGRGHTQSL